MSAPGKFIFEQESSPVYYFALIDISQGSVATCLRCGGIFDDGFIADFLESVTVKDFWKLSSINTIFSRGLLFLTHFVDEAHTAHAFMTDSNVGQTIVGQASKQMRRIVTICQNWMTPTITASIGTCRTSRSMYQCSMFSLDADVPMSTSVVVL